jgi:hypothetical protein
MLFVLAGGCLLETHSTRFGSSRCKLCHPYTPFGHKQGHVPAVVACTGWSVWVMRGVPVLFMIHHLHFNICGALPFVTCLSATGRFLRPLLTSLVTLKQHQQQLCHNTHMHEILEFCTALQLQVGIFGRFLQASSHPNSSSFVVTHPLHQTNLWCTALCLHSYRLASSAAPCKRPPNQTAAALSSHPSALTKTVVHCIV